MDCHYVPKHINKKWNIVRHISTLCIMHFFHKSFTDFPAWRIWEFIITLMQMKQRKDYFWYCSCTLLIPHPEYLIAFLIDLHPDSLSPQSASILRAKKKNKHLSAKTAFFPLLLWGLTWRVIQQATDLWHPICAKRLLTHAHHKWQMTAELWRHVGDEKANCRLTALRKKSFLCAILDLIFRSGESSVWQHVWPSSVCPSARGSPTTAAFWHIAFAVCLLFIRLCPCFLKVGPLWRSAVSHRALSHIPLSLNFKTRLPPPLKDTAASLCVDFGLSDLVRCTVVENMWEEINAVVVLHCFFAAEAPKWSKITWKFKHILMRH